MVLHVTDYLFLVGFSSWGNQAGRKLQINVITGKLDVSRCWSLDRLRTAIEVIFVQPRIRATRYTLGR